MNEKKLGSLARNGYLYTKAASGTYKFEVPKSLTWDTQTLPIIIDVELGKQYFVKYTVYPVGSDLYPSGIIDTHFYSKLEVVPSRAGKLEIKNRKLSK